MPPEAHPDQIAKRLEAIWLASGIPTKAEFAGNAGLAANRFSNYLSRNRPDLDGAMGIALTYGVTLDFIYVGDIRGVPVEKAAKVRAAMAQIERRGMAEIEPKPQKRQRGRPKKSVSQ